MHKYFFRPFIADPVCASSNPGHHVDVGRYFMAVVKSSVMIPVRAEVLWNHRPHDVDVALRSTRGVAEWTPEWQVLLVPRACLAGQHTECDAALSLAAPRCFRRY